MVEVYAWDKLIGKIKEEGGISYFSLSPFNKLDFSPIKLKEKARDYQFSSLTFQNGLPGLINDSLPGVYGKQYLDEFFMKHFKTRPTYLETLQFLGENTMGALTYRPEYEFAKKVRESLIFDAIELYDETKKALQGDADFSINEIIAISSSAASGARPKAIVGFNPETKKMHVGLKYVELPEGFVHSIVKFDNLIYDNVLKGISAEEKISQTKGEYIYSLVAKSVGIEMANTYLVEADGATHFVTERFDIKKDSEGLTRRHMHSLSGLLHHNPVESTFGYENLLKVGEMLNIPHADRVQFFKTMLFNLIFGNTDDHSRNFSYLMDQSGKWRGAPAYDLTFSTNRKHQMMFNYKNAYDLKRDHLIKFADIYNIKGSREMIEQMIDAKHSYLKELSTQYQLKEWYNRIIEKTKTVLQ